MIHVSVAGEIFGDNSVMTSTARFVSRITRDTLALVLAGGRGSRLKMLTDWRAKPAVPFGGKFRIIDFALSNCVNSGVRRVQVFTQYKSHTLIRHLQRGWNILSHETGEFVELVPAQQWVDEDTWYEGTADAVYQGLDIIAANEPEYVLILAGDHVYKMDYGEMLAAHVGSGADFTIGCYTVALAEASNFGVMAVDDQYRINSFREKPERPVSLPNDPDAALVSMGIYVFSFEYLRENLLRDAGNQNSNHDFGKDIIPYAVRKGHHVQAYPFFEADVGNAYWRDVGTIDAYYQSNMELLHSDSPLDLYNPGWRILTYQEQLPPAQFTGSSGEFSNSMVSGGCVMHSAFVENSLLSSNVLAQEKSQLRSALVLPGCQIGRGARLNKVLLDNGCVVPDGMVIGEDPELDSQRFHRTEEGVVVVSRKMLGQERRYQLSGLGT